MKKIQIVLLLLLSMTCTAQQDSATKISKFSIGLSYNSSNSQVSPFQLSSWGLSGGSGIIDNDANILSAGNKKDKSLSLSLNFKYRLAKKTFIKGSYVFTSINLTSSFNSKDSQTRQSNSVEVESNIDRFNGGIQFTLAELMRVRLFGGLGFSFIKYGDMIITVYGETRELITDTLKFSVNTTIINPGGSAMGIEGSMGFEISILKNLSFAFEINSAVLRYQSTGNVIQHSTGKVYPSTLTMEDTEFENSYRAVRFSKITSSIGIMYYF